MEYFVDALRRLRRVLEASRQLGVGRQLSDLGVLEAAHLGVLSGLRAETLRKHHVRD